MLRPADQLLAPALSHALAAVDLEDADLGAARLARLIAETIDANPGDVETLTKLSPKLLDLLRDLGMTPAARAKIGTERPTGSDNKLTEFLAGGAA